MAIHTTAYVAQRLWGEKFAYCYHSLVSADEAKAHAEAMGDVVARVVEMPAIVFEDGDVIEATWEHYQSNEDGIDRKIASSPVRGTVRVTTLNSENIFGEKIVMAKLERPLVALHAVALDGRSNVLSNIRVV